MFKILRYLHGREVNCGECMALSDAVWSFYDYLHRCTNHIGTLFENMELSLFHDDQCLICAYNDGDKLIIRDTELYSYMATIKLCNCMNKES